MRIKHVIFAGLVVLVLLLLCTCIKEHMPAAPEETTPVTTEATTEPTVPVIAEPPTTRQIIAAFAKEHGLTLGDYPEPLINLLERNPETQSFVLNYPLEADLIQEIDLWEYAQSEAVPLFMQWDQRWGYLDYGGEPAGLSACGPVSLSMVVCYLTGDYSYGPDYMIRYAINNGYCAPGNGSYWSLISGGGRDFGLDVTEFAPDKERIIANLEVGNPIICIMGPGDFTSSGHFIVLAGLEDGKIRVNDPNSYANSRQLWDYDAIADQIMNVWVLRK